ncbi:MAG: valine--tRNA ligase [Verrucomicrobiota bacterium]|nr:valine--tRNA ligase [Verrucomicrobiota bacterium]
MNDLPKAYDPKTVEEKWLIPWGKEETFQADPTSSKPPFSIVMPPPNVTGRLHVGHALVNTLQDLVVRWKRMQGFEVLWLPGTDHAGIATQTVVERALYQETGKQRRDFPREEFLQHLWRWKESSEQEILSQIKRLGCSCDWSRLHFTMDAESNRSVRTAFKRLFDAGLIYRGDYLVNWDPVTGTALSDDEVEHEEISSFLWHIRYPLVGEKGAMIVATTRPETLFGDAAVAVHPEDPRYRHLIGKQVRLPLTARTIPIIGDIAVDPAFGTGALKITPAHDFLDFEVGERHQLPRLNILTPDARLNADAGPCAGMSIEKGRRTAVALLKEEGLLEKEEPHLLRVGISYRSKAILQPYLSKQWFLRMGPFKEKLLSIVREKQVRLIPDHWESTYVQWIENLRDWCLSRQLWWGHRIPIWYKGEEMVSYDGEGEPPCVEKEPGEWHQDPDVLDTWFSSALWPLSTLGWPENSPEFRRFYPTSLLVTGHDILFFWVARMILMGDHFTHSPPFSEVFLHGLIYGKSYWRKEAHGAISYLSKEEKRRYDLGETLPANLESKWEKMSKSKGNVIDPLEMIDRYGTDAVRFGLASLVTGARQLDLDERRFEECRNFLNKIWNGARFVLGQIDSSSLSQGLNLAKGLRLEDRWILSLLQKTIAEVQEELSRYAFDKMTALAYDFFWNDFCSLYLEASKPALFGKMSSEEQAQKRALLSILLTALVRLLHPLLPFITEELFSHLKQCLPPEIPSEIDCYTKETLSALQAKNCSLAPFPSPVAKRDEEAETDFALMKELVRTVRNIRAEMAIPPTEKSDLYLIGKGPASLLAQKEKELLLSLTPTKELFFTEEQPSGFGATALWQGVLLYIPLPPALKAKELSRLEKEKDKWEKALSGLRGQLANADFCERAPQAVREKVKAQYEEAELTLRKLEEKIRTQ